MLPVTVLPVLSTQLLPVTVLPNCLLDSLNLSVRFPFKELTGFVKVNSPTPHFIYFSTPTCAAQALRLLPYAQELL